MIGLNEKKKSKVRRTMEKLKETKTWIAGLQWFFFICANIVVIPITVGEAFGLSNVEIVPLLLLSFIVTGLACLAQVLFGHKRHIMEGQSGLWWGIFLTLVTTTSAQGMSLTELGGSLALGDRKSTRLYSTHVSISYVVVRLKKQV